eukprot:TRINITY_DN9486_c0_g1_i1.p1 TRINITY_DN9486_c0_g1~~TRINITY_DN9486_c0_g1_i1.p1  ORF type:complete len:607 (+),score=108.84 TRINITY_DN9486_c0_g1_i1:221-2041(+)
MFSCWCCLLFFACLTFIANAQPVVVSPGSDLSAAISSSTTKTFSLGSGSYTIGTTVFLSTAGSLTLVGAGVDQTVVDCEGKRGFYITSGSSLTIQKLTIKNCVSDDSLPTSPPPSNAGGGAAIYATDDSLVSLFQVRFENNLSHQTKTDLVNGGGAISIDSTVKLQADNCTFFNNIATHAGALYVAGSSSIEITNSYFFSNNATDGNGGVVYCTDETTCSISNSLLESNSATQGNGGVIFSNKNSKIFSEANAYQLNSASYGGVHYPDDDSVCQFVSDQFIRNRALNSGGMSEVSANSDVTWRLCTFIENTSSGTLVILMRGGIRGVVDSCVFESFGYYRNNEAMFSGISGNLTVTNTTFRKGFAAKGGGLSVAGNIKNFLMEDSLFEDNAAFDTGAFSVGGLSFDPSAQIEIVIRRTKFRNNRAITSGGAVGGQGLNRNFSVQFYDCEFTNNEAGVSSGVAFFENSGSWLFENCKFEGNSAQSGGVMGIIGSAVVKVSKSSFQSNTAFYGGALFATSKGEFEIESSTFLSNKATLYGGVFFSDFMALECPQFVNTKFIDNTATESGGALFFQLSADYDQKAICNKVSRFCDDCTFSKNKAVLLWQ